MTPDDAAGRGGGAFVHLAQSLDTLTPEERMAEVQVAGRRMLRALSVFERDCLQMIVDEQEKLAPDNALIALLCDGVRLAREHTDSQQI